MGDTISISPSEKVQWGSTSEQTWKNPHRSDIFACPTLVGGPFSWNTRKSYNQSWCCPKCWVGLHTVPKQQLDWLVTFFAQERASFHFPPTKRPGGVCHIFLLVNGWYTSFCQAVLRLLQTSAQKSRQCWGSSKALGCSCLFFFLNLQCCHLQAEHLEQREGAHPRTLCPDVLPGCAFSGRPGCRTCWMHLWASSGDIHRSSETAQGNSEHWDYRCSSPIYNARKPRGQKTYLCSVHTSPTQRTWALLTFISISQKKQLAIRHSHVRHSHVLPAGGQLKCCKVRTGLSAS